MCGVAASIGRVAGDEPRRRALERLRRRGPDAAGEWTSPDRRVWLGHRRLSIVDLSAAGNQPLCDPAGASWLVCNGEIYNAPTLRRELEARGARFRSHSDNEVILHAYGVWGDAAVERLEGMFAFVLWDEARGRFLAARDRIGIKPLYWAEAGGGVHFASEAGALLELLPARPAPDPVALGQVLTLGYVPAPGSIWRGVRKLEPGVRMSGAPGATPRSERYWSLPDGLEDARPAARDFRERFEAVLSEHLLSDVPVGLFLSGGIDSSAIAVGLADLGQRTEAFTLGFPDAAGDETPLAAATAARLGLPHQTAAVRTGDVAARAAAVLGRFDEPQGFGALLTMDAISQAAAASFKVALSGDGGDEIFAGYAWYADLDAAPRPGLLRCMLRALPAWGPARRRAARERAFAARSPLHRHAWRVFPRLLPDEAAELLAPLGGRFGEQEMIGPLERHFAPRLPLVRALQRVDLATFCADSILPKVDRASMAHSLEVRVPFLDRRLVEHALAWPVVPGEPPKALLRELLRERVPDAVLAGPKRGFSLRTLGGFDWELARRRVREGPWVRGGLFSPAWERFAAPGLPGWEGRLFGLWLLDAWGRAWLDGAGRPLDSEATRSDRSA